MNKGSILGHVTVIENPNYHKLLIVGDIAILPVPEMSKKITITNYLINTTRALGIERPKVALITASEQVSYKIPSSVDTSLIAKMSDRGQIKGADIDGPLALDAAIDPESATDRFCC